MLLIFEAIWEPLEQRQEHIAMYFSPSTSPARMLAWIAEWLNLELDPHWPERRRRELLREAMQLYWWRGTRYGLTRMLEVCTGQPVRDHRRSREAVRVPDQHSVAHRRVS